ncbi:hypothetical protein BGX24_010029, partial [Mortierella sp. AD032]
MTESTQHPDDDYLHLDLAEPEEDRAQVDKQQQLEAAPETQAYVEAGTLAKAITTTTPIQTLPGSDTEMELGAMTQGDRVILLTGGLDSHNHSDEHVFLDFVHDPLSHAAQDSIASVSAIVGDGHDSHADSQLSMALGTQDTSSEGIDIQRPFVDLLGSHEATLGAL